MIVAHWLVIHTLLTDQPKAASVRHIIARVEAALNAARQAEGEHES